MTIDPNNLAGTATLTFSDEFNTFKIWDGSSGWDTKSFYDPAQGSMGGNGAWYINEGYGPTDAINPWMASNGVLSITAAPASTEIRPYIGNASFTTGSINTYNDFSQTYGYFEMRAKMPAQSGYWPAFWLIPTSGAWPPELDVVEAPSWNRYGYQATTHWTNASNQHDWSTEFYDTGVDISAGFHNYGALWTKEKITYYFDGKVVGEIATPADMHESMFMIANLAVNDPNASGPATMQIDYIRAYKDGGSSVPSPAPTPLPDPTPAPAPSVPSPTPTPSPTPPAETATFSKTTFWGTSRADVAIGNNLNNKIYGAGGNDVLKGSAGNDFIDGGAGFDDLFGGAGNDTFYFSSGNQAHGDWIHDFSRGEDSIDLSNIDAKVGVSGSQAFTFIGMSPFTAPGQLRYYHADGVTKIEGSTDSDAAAEFLIEIKSLVALTASDFVL